MLTISYARRNLNADQGRVPHRLRLPATDADAAHAERASLPPGRSRPPARTSASIRPSRRTPTPTGSAISARASWRPPGLLTISTEFVGPDSGAARHDSHPTRRRSRSKSCPTTCSSTCSAAATAKPTGCPTPPGRCSATPSPAGTACRRSATSCTAASASATSTPAPPAPPGKATRNKSASAATSPISPSRSAAA